MNTGLRRIPDPYNETKFWLVIRYERGNYYINQENAGYKLNRRFARTTREALSDILGGDISELF